MDDRCREFVLLPSVRAYVLPDQRIQLPLKYLNGADQFARYWPGPLTSLVRKSATLLEDADAVAVDPTQWRSGVEFRPTNKHALANRLGQAAIVFAGLEGRELTTARFCRNSGVPLVFNSEYTLQTDLDVIDAGKPHWIRRFRRRARARWDHRRRIAALRLASGLQCSGTPTYDAYQRIIPNSLLFFDNRVPEASSIKDIELEEKCRSLLGGQPLRLGFGGRLTAMKGVMDLPKVLRILRRRGLDFRMTIVGHGDLEQLLRTQIHEMHLDDRTRILRTLDFESGWLSLLRREIDVFICCHPQGDPSSTYSEAMSCGVPILGYANEAWSGLRALSEGGWEVPIGDVEGMASVVQNLDRNRALIESAAQNAARFGAMHGFEATFKARVGQLIRTSRLPFELKDVALAQLPS